MGVKYTWHQIPKSFSDQNLISRHHWELAIPIKRITGTTEKIVGNWQLAKEYA